MSSSFDLSRKKAFITGASRGLGWEIAKALCHAGCTVYVNARDEDHLKTITADIKNAEVCAFDITDYETARKTFQNIGTLDILINNVGIRDRKTIDEFHLEDVRNLFENNLIAPFELARLASKQMPHGGRIINITSIAGHIARSGDSVYTASKAALTGLTRAFAAELGKDNITVNAIAPGFFATEANQEMTKDEGINTFVKNRTSLCRWGRPEEITGACLFLASDSASYITGHVLFVDGGMSAHF